MPPTRTRTQGTRPSAERRVERVRRLLLSRGMPRVQMSLILAATGAAGFVFSFLLLHAGLTRMWLRYPLAVLFAYGVFLLLLRVWLHLQRNSWVDLMPDDLNILDATRVGERARADPLSSFGGGGDFGGGGAGGGWADGVKSAASARCDVGGDAGGGSGGGGGGSGLLDGLSIDADEGCVFFLLAIALVAAGALASLYVVYAAPTLLAELLVEGLLLSGLYKGMKEGARQGDWLRAVVRRTWLPVILTLMLFGAAGYFLQRAAPRARSIGEAFRAVSTEKQ